MPAFLIGTYLLLNRKGTDLHKMLGKVYMLLSQDEGTIKFKTKNKDMYFGRDKYGVFYFGTETIKENDHPVKTRKFKIYLKPSNKSN